MPKQKKPPKNAYFYFINMRREELEAKGYRIGNFQNASLEFGPEWSRLTKEEKAPFEKMAKDAKEQEKYNVNNKFTVTGESYADIHQKVMEQRTAQEQMEEFITRLTGGYGYEDRMYIIMKAVHSAEEIIDKNTRLYWPLELSMSAFSLRGGMKAIYTTLVDTKVSPVGYASAAKENCAEVLLPLPGDKSYTDECRDYKQMLHNISGFANHWLKDGYNVPGHKHVFFALDSEREPIVSCIQWLVNQMTGRDKEKYQQFVDNLKVYKLSKLILSMAEIANRVNPSYENYLVTFKLDSAAESIILKGNYDYRDEIACSYHRSDMANMKMHTCAQSIVMRRIFMLFEEFGPAYRFRKTDRHQIDKVGKGQRGPMIKRIREEEPEEPIQVQEPSWLKDDPPSTCSWDQEQDTSHDDDFNPWSRKRPAPTPKFRDDDFPSVGGGRGRGSGGSSRPSSSYTFPGVGSTSKRVMDDDFPALGFASSGGRGRGRY